MKSFAVESLRETFKKRLEAKRIKGLKRRLMPVTPTTSVLEIEGPPP